jgi:hypothetical protein
LRLQGAEIRDHFHENHKTPTGEQKQYWRTAPWSDVYTIQK